VAQPRTDIDVIDELITDHREALELLRRIASTTDADERRELADTVISEVVRHSVAEEMYVYPAMREYMSNGDEAVKHDTEEHQELEEVMKQLEGVQATEPRFDALVQEMTDKLRHHAHDEESEQFPKLRERVPRDELIKLREKVDTAKKLAPTRPHPGAPHSELFHKIVGPGVGMVDRLRDKLTNRAH
jgi:hemerythrin superfamily protein